MHSRENYILSVYLKRVVDLTKSLFKSAKICYVLKTVEGTCSVESSQCRLVLGKWNITSLDGEGTRTTSNWEETPVEPQLAGWTIYQIWSVNALLGRAGIPRYSGSKKSTHIHKNGKFL